MKRWRYREYDPAVADRLETEAKLPRVTAVLLAQRGVCEPAAVAEFLAPTLNQLHDPYRLLGMRAAVERIRRAVANEEKILIYGDYDVDGTTATVVLRAALRMIGGDADFHVPHRVEEGYGMREDVIERAARDEVKLLISVDTGIREAAVVDRARELGVDAIITDHHLPEDGALPRAVAVLNPNQPGCDYPDKVLCGVGIAFKLAQALLADLDWTPAKRERVLLSLLKMTAIGTIADLVPLTGENRVIAKLGLDGLPRPANPGLKALLDVAGLGGKAVSAGDVGFRIGPRINAAGRMDTARDVVTMFTTEDAAEAERIAQHLDRLNTERRQAEEDVVEEILASFGDRVPPPDVLPFLVVEGDGWHPGVIGIAASRIVERFHRPTVVLSLDRETGLAVGSGRSIPAFHLLESLESVAPIFERFGGHKQAAGCTIRADRIATLREQLNEYAVNVLSIDDFIPELKVDCEVGFDRIGDELMASVAKLAPHGMGNPTPVFSTLAVQVGEVKKLKERHLKTRLNSNGCGFSAVGWRMGELADGFVPGAAVDAAFNIEPDDYWGGWQLSLKDLRATASG